MAKYRIDLPDGRKIDVDAESPEQAAEGGEAWMRSNPLTGRAAADADARRRIRSAPAPLRAITKGASLGFADELDALGAGAETGISNVASRLVGKQPRYSMGDAFAAVMAANAQGDAKFADEHPVANVGLQVLGGVATPGAAAGARYIGAGRGLIGSTLRSAAVGAGAGAVAGAGNGRGGAVDRARAAGSGAVTGALVGAAMPSVGRAAQAVGRAANAAIGQPFGGAARGAAGRLREALHQDGLSEAQIRGTIDQWQRSGVTPEFLNVVGENTRALLRAAGSQPGAARNTAQAYRDRTVSSIPRRAIERANALTPGETRTPAQFADSASAAREAAAQRNYAGPYATPVDVPETVSDMLRDQAGRSIVARARADAIENSDWGMQAELDMLLNGARDGQLPRVSAGTIDRLVIAARERGQSLAQRGARNRARGSMGRRDVLDEVLDDVPEIQPARRQFERQSRAIEAATEGPSVMAPRSEFEPAIDALDGNAFALRGAQVRERQALRDKFGVRDQVKGILDDIANAPDVRPNLQQLYGERGEQFADAAGNLSAKQEHANFIAPNTGSQTQPRGQDANRLFGAISQGMEVLGGSIRPLLERAARGLTMTERERQILLELGVGSPDDALRALSAPQGPAGQLTGAGARRAATSAAPVVAGDRQRQPAVEAWLGDDPNVYGAAY